MGPAFSWLLALRYLRSRWVNVLAVIGVAVAVAALIFVRSMFTGFLSDIRVNVRKTAPDLLITSLPHEQSFADLEQLLARDDLASDIAAIAPRLRHYGVFYQRNFERGTQHTAVDFNNVNNSFVQLIGIDPEREQTVTGFLSWVEAAPTARRRPARPSRPAGAPVACRRRAASR